MCVCMKQFNHADKYLHKFPSKITGVQHYGQKQPDYQGEHIFPAASSSLPNNCASPSRARGPHACGGSDRCWSVVKVRRIEERMAAMWPTGFAARELLLGGTDEQRAPRQHAHFVASRRSCC